MAVGARRRRSCVSAFRDACRDYPALFRDRRLLMRTASVPAACTVAIVGAGPAGLAAATLAAELGLEVVLIDQQPHPGGQIYRAIGAISPDRRLLPGDE